MFSVWYQVDNADMPHAHDPVMFCSGLTERSAERVAKQLPAELRWLIGSDLQVKAWVE